MRRVGRVVLFIVRVECERLVPIRRFRELALAEQEVARLTAIEPTRYLLLDYDPELVVLPPRAESRPRTSHRCHEPGAGGRRVDVRALLLKLEHASLSCRVARTTRTASARLRSIRIAREALQDAKRMAVQVSMSDGERLWFQTTAAAVSSEILSEMTRAGG